MSTTAETITAIEQCSVGEEYSKQAGFKITTTEQEIFLLIDDESSCCESWGYFLTEDDTTKFVGAHLRNIVLTDTNRSSKVFVKGYDYEAPYDDAHEHLDEGDVMFVDIETDRGVLQFVAYNAHNGYYGHSATIKSNQLQHQSTL